MSSSNDAPLESTPVSLPSTMPVLSYKKRKNKTVPGQKNGVDNTTKNTPNLDLPDVLAPNTPLSVQGTPTLKGTRKVLNRRKALQDFYRLNAADANGPEIDVQSSGRLSIEGLGITGAATEEKPFDPEALLERLSDESHMNEFLKSASAKDILKARNAAASKLNHHDLERKSIIYNNYSELIKLNQILNDIFDAKKPVSEFAHADDESTVTNESIDEYLGDLSAFLKTEAAVFNLDFVSVVRNLRLGIDGADSDSSMVGIAEN